MPKRTDISSILVIGAGPIVIGQACEFDYSGTQACKALKEEGYRVASLPVVLPPLRERLEDLPLLVKHFTGKASNPQFDARLVEFTEDAMAIFRAYHWPGNLAELEQVITKIVATTEVRVVTSQQLPMRLREVRHWPTLAEYLAGQERQYIEMVLHACKGDQAKAATVLGVDAAKLD